MAQQLSNTWNHNNNISVYRKHSLTFRYFLEFVLKNTRGVFLLTMLLGTVKWVHIHIVVSQIIGTCSWSMLQKLNVYTGNYYYDWYTESLYPYRMISEHCVLMVISTTVIIASTIPILYNYIGQCCGLFDNGIFSYIYSQVITSDYYRGRVTNICVSIYAAMN